MSHALRTAGENPPVELPLGPTLAEWQAMSPRQQEAWGQAAIDALNATQEMRAESRPHGLTRMQVTMALRDHFQRARRAMFIASDLPVAYPGEPMVSPDLIVIEGVEDLDLEDHRLSWDVEAEGRGVDLAMEILYQGDRDKDLVSNVARYARLGIPEYFVYDRMNQRLYGYRLLGPKGRSYERIPLWAGRLPSRVLGLELALVGGRLRFFQGDAMLPESRELIARLELLVSENERRIDEEVAARLAAEARAAEEAAARAEEAAARAELEARLAALLAERERGS